MFAETNSVYGFIFLNMRFFGLTTGILLLFAFQGHSQQLIINEISQGTSSKEYVELLVAGIPTCQTPVPCLDLRGYVIDDNNGDFASGSGTGIASGAVRFADDPFWSCIPQGTLIVIYNSNDVNPALPPNDLSMTDGNCSLIIPINSVLFEGQSTSPTSGNASYPATGWVAGGSAWNQIAMSNTNDSFQTRMNATATGPIHAVNWGNNTTNSTIYFPSAGGNVFYMSNTADNNPLLQANWAQGAVGVDETPGSPNTPENAAFIASMNPECGTASTITVVASSTDTGCGTGCTGTASVQISGGTAPYTILWSNGSTATNLSNLCAGTYTVNVTDATGCSMNAQTTVSATSNTITLDLNSTDETCDGICDGEIVCIATGIGGPYNFNWSNGANSSTISNLCPGNYTVTVTDQNGCSATANGSVQPGVPTQPVEILTTGPFETSDPSVQFQADINGGTWGADCGSCMSSTGVFDPSTVAPGQYQVCYTVGTGSCQSNDCQTITVTEGCVTQQTSENVGICPGTSITINGQTLSSEGSYPFTFTDQLGCDSIHTVVVNFLQVDPIHTFHTICEGDSVDVNGIWYYDPDIVTWTSTDLNGCVLQNTATITLNNCIIEPYSVFIPNTFTPNNDLVNDLFTIVIKGGLLNEGYILNRWGEVVKVFDTFDTTWDGKTQQGLDASDGVYTYVITVDQAGGTREQYHGFVTIVR